MANLKKIYHNWTAYNIPVTSVNNSTGDVTVQETLVSWTNIKTINNQSLLGSGNITIESWWIQNDTTGTTSTVTKIRAWTEAEFNALSSKDATTIYHVF